LKIVAEDKVIDIRIEEFLSDWEEEKYVFLCTSLTLDRYKAVSKPRQPSTFSVYPKGD
jgi:hypothetical protein